MTVFFIIYVFILSRTNQIVSFGKLFILLLSEGFMRERVTTIYWDLYIIKWTNCANHFKYRSTRLLPGWDFITSSCLQRSCWPQTHYSYRQSDDVTYLFLLPLVGSSVPQISFDVTEKVLLGKHLIIAVISVIIVDLLLYLSISFLIIIAENSLRTKLV